MYSLSHCFRFPLHSSEALHLHLHLHLTLSPYNPPGCLSVDDAKKDRHRPPARDLALDLALVLGPSLPPNRTEGRDLTAASNPFLSLVLMAGGYMCAGGGQREYILCECVCAELGGHVR